MISLARSLLFAHIVSSDNCLRPYSGKRAAATSKTGISTGAGERRQAFLGQKKKDHSRMLWKHQTCRRLREGKRVLRSITQLRYVCLEEKTTETFLQITLSLVLTIHLPASQASKSLALIIERTETTRYSGQLLFDQTTAPSSSGDGLLRLHRSSVARTIFWAEARPVHGFHRSLISPPDWGRLLGFATSASLLPMQTSQRDNPHISWQDWLTGNRMSSEVVALVSATLCEDFHFVWKYTMKRFVGNSHLKASAYSRRTEATPASDNCAAAWVETPSEVVLQGPVGLVGVIEASVNPEDDRNRHRRRHRHKDTDMGTNSRKSGSKARPCAKTEPGCVCRRARMRRPRQVQ
ncbi:unnamed protein product [Protopolystoma xenopodis]|uniref:Uncharacterized protein n=1 Tax=Protopolystoma xenopodis TaxID=117903 RepID=A0A3S5BV61_9PLAT|nr:unnamed protein product [Protopolystoma xenopodis]